jgi:hypothetical protein
MDDTNYDMNRLEILGYEVLPRPHPHSPGYKGLRLALPQHASGHELDALVLTVVDWQGRPHVRKIHAGTTPDESDKVAPGRIYIRSHRESEGTFYTFGGRLTVEPLAQETILTISSTAPLLELTPRQETATNLLAAEAEVLLGKVEMAQGWSDPELMEHLTSVEPLALYLAILQSLSTSYEDADALRHRQSRLASLIQSEKKWFSKSGQWSITQPDLATLARRL